ncbi:7555_t:CDS:2, partial [Gigaspora margarita]
KDENIREIYKMPCPSTSAFPRRWKEYNENPLKRYNLRSPECSGPPVSLFYPVFSQFLADYHNYKLDVPAERYIQVLEFCHIVRQIYKNEGDRQYASRPFFTKLFDGIQPISIATNNGSIDDDVLLTDNVVFGEKAVPILWEYKNEIGTRGKDPSIQGGSLYLEKPVIEPLTDFILIADRPEDDGKRVKELVVFFESLRLVFRTLDNYYKNLRELDEAEIEKIQRFFPYRNQYQINENENKFTYLYKLTEEPRDLTWKAETNRGKIGIAKFTKSNDHLLRGKNILYADDESFKATRIRVIRLFLSVFVTMCAHCNILILMKLYEESAQQIDG